LWQGNLNRREEGYLRDTVGFPQGRESFLRDKDGFIYRKERFLSGLAALLSRLDYIFSQEAGLLQCFARRHSQPPAKQDFIEHWPLEAIDRLRSDSLRFDFPEASARILPHVYFDTYSGEWHWRGGGSSRSVIKPREPQ
jgi:hypothetical protein